MLTPISLRLVGPLRLLVLLSSVALVGAACSGSDGPLAPDGAASDRGADSVAVDGGGGADVVPTDGATGADGDEACLSVPALAAHTLTAGYCAVAAFDAPAPGPFAIEGDSALWFFEADAAVDNHFAVVRYPREAGAAALGAGTSVFGFTVDTADNLFPGAYLALSAAGDAAVGYSLASDFSGAVMVGRAGETAETIAAKGNYDVIFWDDDSLLINGLGAGTSEDGQGLYLYKGGQGRKLVGALGAASGPLCKGQDVLFVGGFFETENRVFAFSAAEVVAAISNAKTLAADVDGDLVYQGPLTDAVAFGNDLIVIDDDWQTFVGVKRVPVSVDGASVSKGDTVPVLAAGNQENKVTELEVGSDGSGTPTLGMRVSTGADDQIVLLRQL